MSATTPNHETGIEAAYEAGARRGTLITLDDAGAIVAAYLRHMPTSSLGTAKEWRVVQRWPNGEKLVLPMDGEKAARGRQAVLDANTSHPSGYQRRVEVVRIECRDVGPWRKLWP
jgi:hypothetical protein